MKNQATKFLAFKKNTITELNQDQLKTIVGGTGIYEQQPQSGLATSHLCKSRTGMTE